MPKPTTYRLNVAGVIFNQPGQILICERYGKKGAWQLPQGGVEKGEELEDAFYREMLEEIGTDNLDLVGMLPESIKYDWPPNLHRKGHLGQEQYYFFARIIDPDSIRLDTDQNGQEFQDFKWVGIEEFCETVSGFKKKTYIKAIKLIGKTFPKINLQP